MPDGLRPMATSGGAMYQSIFRDEPIGGKNEGGATGVGRSGGGSGGGHVGERENEEEENPHQL